MPVTINLPARVGDDPELIEHPIYHRPVPRDVPAYVEQRFPGADPEAVVFVWVDGASAVWDSSIPGGFSVPRVPLEEGPSKLPETTKEAEALYDIETALGVSQDLALRRLNAYDQHIRTKIAERDTTDGDVFMTPRDIAKRFRIPYDRLRKRLERWRRASMLAEGSYIENPDALPNQAKYCYNLRAVEPIIRELQGKHAKRPANVQRTDR